MKIFNRMFLVSLLLFFSIKNVISETEKYKSYGVNGWFWSLASIDTMKKAHLYYYRVMVPWFCLEQAKNDYHWEGITGSDRSAELKYHLINFVAANRGAKDKVKISLCIYNSPNWARKDPARVLSYDPKDYADFVVAVLKYCDSVAPGIVEAVEVQNEEPTGAWVDKPPVNGTGDRDPSQGYAETLKLTYREVKAYNPKILVVMDGIWGESCQHLDDLYQLGCKGYFDRINLHYYVYSSEVNFIDIEQPGPDDLKGFWNLPTTLGYLKHISNQYGDNIPIWVTEFGWQSAKNDTSKANKIESFLDICSKSGMVERINYYCNYSQKPFERFDDAYNRTPLGLTYIDTLENLIYEKNSGPYYQERVEYGQYPVTYSFSEGYDRIKKFAEKKPVWDKKEPLTFLPAPGKDANIINAGFESGKEGWSGDFEIVSDIKHSGNNCAKIKVPGILKSKIFDIEPFKLYDVSFWVKMNGDINKIICVPYIELLIINEDTEDAGGKTNQWRWGVVETSKYPGGWRKVRFAVVPTEESRFCRFKFDFKDEGEAWIDDVSMSALDLSYLNK